MERGVQPAAEGHGVAGTLLLDMCVLSVLAASVSTNVFVHVDTRVLLSLEHRLCFVSLCLYALLIANHVAYVVPRPELHAPQSAVCVAAAAFGQNSLRLYGLSCFYDMSDLFAQERVRFFGSRNQSQGTRACVFVFLLETAR